MKIKAIRETTLKHWGTSLPPVRSIEKKKEEKKEEVGIGNHWPDQGEVAAQASRRFSGETLWVIQQGHWRVGASAVLDLFQKVPTQQTKTSCVTPCAVEETEGQILQSSREH